MVSTGVIELKGCKFLFYLPSPRGFSWYMVQLGEVLVAPPYAKHDQTKEDVYQQRRHDN